MRDRADDLLAEEDDLARALASTWARDPDRRFPRLHAEPDRLLAEAGSVLDDRLDAGDRPRHPLVQASGLGPGRRRRRRAWPTA